MKDFLRKLFGQKLINYYHLAGAILANFVYGFPSRKLRVIGVTGTDGKTTVVNLIAAILKEAGLKTSFLSTINTKIDKKEYDTGLHTTTPSPFLLQKLLSKMVRAGSEYAILEVTSHALDQYRTWGINFETGVLTNITHEHLDYHKTYKEYVRAKAKLLKNVRFAVLNRDDESFNYLTKGGEEGGVLTYGLSNQAHIWADNIREDLKNTNFTAHTPSGKFGLILPVPGRFNVYNALAATAVAQTYNISPEIITSALGKIRNITGRMEFFDGGQEFYAMVDFAHTPNALEKSLSFLRQHVTGKLIAVFGAAGERDYTKRPMMGAVADKYADLIVITRDDNRSEDVTEISRQIASGIKNKQLNETYYIIPDRREALRFALRRAQKGDMVVISGKGHEMSLNIDGVEKDWNDREAMQEELRALQNPNHPHSFKYETTN